jgi:hypothetical protein
VISCHEAFFGKYESAWGLTQKIAWLNVTNPAKFFAVPLGFKQAPIDPQGGHRNFVYDNWLKERTKFAEADGGASIDDLTDALRTLNGRTGRAIFGEMASRLMTSQLRVCPLCIQRGYHSIVHQIEGLVQCPIHEVPLISTCPKCNQALGEFGLRRCNPYRCTRCDACLLAGDELFYLPEGWRESESRLIGSIVAHLHSLESARLNWPAKALMPLFRVRGTSAIDHITNAQACLRVLNRISPLPVATAVLCSEPAGLKVSPWCSPISPPEWDGKDEFARLHEVCAQARGVATAVYKQIRSLSAAHEGCLFRVGPLLWFHRMPGQTQMHCHPLLCPVVQGLYLWQERVSRYLKEMRRTFSTVWVEDYRRNALPKLHDALVSSFYGCVTGVTLLREFAARKEQIPDDFLNVWLDALDDAWLLFEPNITPGDASPKLAHEVMLNDPELLATPCDEGEA